MLGYKQGTVEAQRVHGSGNHGNLRSTEEVYCGEELTPKLNGRKLGSSGRAKETRHRVTEAQERERTAWRN